GGDRATARLVEVGRLPREPVAALQPLHAELPPDGFLTDLPLVRLDELDHADAPTSGDAAHDDAEGGRRLALAVAGVDEHQRALPRRPHATPASATIRLVSRCASTLSASWSNTASSERSGARPNSASSTDELSKAPCAVSPSTGPRATTSSGGSMRPWRIS